MYGSFCTGFIDFILKGKILLEKIYENIIIYENNDKIILNHFHELKG